MTNHRSTSVSNLIRWLLFPAILLVTVMAALGVSNGISRIIGHGFDRKLAAISTTAGAFVELDDHRRILRPRTVAALGRLPEGGVIGLTGDMHVVQLDPDGSASLDSLYTVPGGTRRMAAGEGILYAWTDEPAGLHIYRMGPDGPGEPLPVPAAAEPGGIAWDPTGGRLFLVSREGRIYHGEAGGPMREMAETGAGEVIDATGDGAGRLALLTAGQEVVWVEAATGSVLSRHEIRCLSGGLPSGDCSPLDNLLWDPRGEHFWSAADRLYKVSAEGAVELDHYTYAGYQDHSSPLYLNYVEPLRRIREEQQLTYLYSFVLNQEEGTISYVLDGSVDEDYTHIGYVDYELPDSEQEEALRVMQTGRPYISGIQTWGQWGLIKVGFAPIFDTGQRGGAIMGADLNVSAINSVSREALVILSLGSFFFLILSGIAAWYISRPLTMPLLSLKENVLRIAAGFYDKPIEKPALVDLHPIAELFGRTVDRLNREITRSTVSGVRFEHERRLHELIVTFQGMMGGFEVQGLRATYRDRPPEAPGRYGAVHRNGRAAAWQIDAEEDPLETLRRHQLLRVLAGRVLEEERELSRFAPGVLKMVDFEVVRLAVWDASDGTLHYRFGGIQEVCPAGGHDLQADPVTLEGSGRLEAPADWTSGWEMTFSHGEERSALVLGFTPAINGGDHDR